MPNRLSKAAHSRAAHQTQAHPARSPSARPAPVEPNGRATRRACARTDGRDRRCACAPARARRRRQRVWRRCIPDRSPSRVGSFVTAGENAIPGDAVFLEVVEGTRSRLRALARSNAAPRAPSRRPRRAAVRPARADLLVQELVTRFAIIRRVNLSSRHDNPGAAQVPAVQFTDSMKKGPRLRVEWHRLTTVVERETQRGGPVVTALARRRYRRHGEIELRDCGHAIGADFRRAQIAFRARPPTRTL